MFNSYVTNYQRLTAVDHCWSNKVLEETPGCFFQDLEDNHNQLLDALKQQGDFCKRMCPGSGPGHGHPWRFPKSRG